MTEPTHNLPLAAAAPLGDSRPHPSLLLSETGAMDDFYLGDDDPCFCLSGHAFAACCGAKQAERAPPYGIFVFENYLSDNLARDLTDFASQRAGERLMVIDQKISTAANIVKVEDPRRIAQRVDIGPRRPEITELVRSAFIGLARRCAGATLDWFEAPDLMRYTTGGRYVKHADSQNMNPATGKWSKVIDRDLSLLIYLNEDYDGGALVFEKFNFRLRPRAGMAVLFPSDSRYMHAAETVTQGVRYALVSWASVRGVPKIAATPPEPALLIDP